MANVWYHKPPIQNETEFLQQLSSVLAFYHLRHENTIIVRNFNMTVKKTPFL